jgi:hypothetical protein
MDNEKLSDSPRTNYKYLTEDVRILQQTYKYHPTDGSLQQKLAK